MRVILQRVTRGSVTVDGRVVGVVDHGLVALVGVTHGDTQAEADLLARKTAHLRVFEDEQGKMNLSALEIGGGVLVISQFTLYADSRKGRRPSFTDAAPPEIAAPLVEYYADRLKAEGITRIEKGVFGAMMQVEIHNDGPVTILLDSGDMQRADLADNVTQDAEFYFKRSNEQYRAGNISGGDADLDRALALAPDNLEYRWKRAYNRQWREQYQLAIEDFLKIIELSTETEALEGIYHSLEVAHYILGLTQEWLADLDWLIAHECATDVEYYSRAIYNRERGRYGEALEDCNKALEMAPGTADLLLQRSIVYHKLKRYEEEINDLTTILMSEKFHAGFFSTIYAKRADAFLSFGDTDRWFSDSNESKRLSRLK